MSERCSPKSYSNFPKGEALTREEPQQSRNFAPRPKFRPPDIEVKQSSEDSFDEIN
jgi:hypothetical protein